MAVGVGELGQGRVQDGDVVGGGVGSGVADPEQSGQGFAGVVQDQAGQLAPPAREAGAPARVSGGLEPAPQRSSSKAPGSSVPVPDTEECTICSIPASRLTVTRLRARCTSKSAIRFAKFAVSIENTAVAPAAASLREAGSSRSPRTRVAPAAASRTAASDDGSRTSARTGRPASSSARATAPPPGCRLPRSPTPDGLSWALPSRQSNGALAARGRELNETAGDGLPSKRLDTLMEDRGHPAAHRERQRLPRHIGRRRRRASGNRGEGRPTASRDHGRRPARPSQRHCHPGRGRSGVGLPPPAYSHQRSGTTDIVPASLAPARHGDDGKPTGPQPTDFASFRRSVDHAGARLGYPSRWRRLSRRPAAWAGRAGSRARAGW